MPRTILLFTTITILLIVIIIKVNKLNKNVEKAKEQQREDILFIAERIDKIRLSKKK